MPTKRPVIFAVAATTALVFAIQPATAAPPTSSGPQAQDGLSARSVAQLDALAAAKLARTPTQRKIGSTLLTAEQLRQGRPLPAGVRAAPKVATDAAGRAALDVRGRIDAGLLARVSALGGVVRDSHPQQGIARVELPLAAVESLAGDASVSRVSLAAEAMTAHIGAPGRQLTKAQRDAILRNRVREALARAMPERTSRAGAVTSEGDRVEAVDTARAAYKVSGVGVTVGVLSDGVSSLASSIASGDLPSDVHVLPGQEGAGDEGTAMLEIVHDLAPNAKLAFATAFTSAESFADNIRALRAAGADIIVDDVIYFAESPFQDGPIAQAVIDVTNDGAMYFSSAGNEGNVDDGTSGNYEGDFRSSGHSIGKFAGIAHDFNPGTPVQVSDPLTPGSSGQPAILQWADPLGAANDDYDLYALDSNGDVVGFSNDVQDGNDDPFEGFYVPGSGLSSVHLAVVKFSGHNRYFQLTAFRGRFANADGLTAYATPGVTRGHSAVPAAVSVAAAPANHRLPFDLEPGDPKNPKGPYPGTFTAAQRSERFTSDGPRRVFFHPDGTPITPGNLTSTGGVVRQKPDVTAADGVRTSIGDFNPFFGTSAAAPHAAAIAALVLSGNPGMSAATVRAALTGTALDIEKPGTDRDTGAGIVMADRVLRATGATPLSYAVSEPARVVGSTDGDAFLEPGETGRVKVPVSNVGDAPARSVRVQLTTTTPGVTITPAVVSYGTIAPGATQAAAAFAVTVRRSAPLGSRVQLTSTVRFAGGPSPTSRDSELLVGEPSSQVVDVSYSGPPVAIPDSDPAGASVHLPVTGVGPVSKVTFSVDGTDCSSTDGSTTVGIDHTYVGDLAGTLVAPNGVSVTLFSRTGGTGANICQAVFDDSAATAFESLSSDDAPFSGTWRPLEPLAGFVGVPGDGSWTFTVVDSASSDTGSLRAVSLHVGGFVHP